MYALAADCSIGSAGSAILMTHSRAAQGEPALIYLKVTAQHTQSQSQAHSLSIECRELISMTTKCAVKQEAHVRRAARLYGCI